MSDTYRMNADEHDAMKRALLASVTIRKPTPVTDRDELVERPVEWFYRDRVTGNLVSAKPPKQFTTDELMKLLEEKAADKARIQSDAAIIERVREALEAVESEIMLDGGLLELVQAALDQ